LVVVFTEVKSIKINGNVPVAKQNQKNLDVATIVVQINLIVAGFTAQIQINFNLVLRAVD
jgi:hypothetical protein